MAYALLALCVHAFQGSSKLMFHLVSCMFCLAARLATCLCHTPLLLCLSQVLAHRRLQVQPRPLPVAASRVVCNLQLVKSCSLLCLQAP
eukprot:CAMPEP_0206497862 /NCGR_PEP_ID=MMETSP0324_2-20121206/50537_1 /ASSEMBLY_ACC=CAM_ASM_000836 /TAXON_ID=2866 /ORGANISM="Crypthecodinium cohnii, Strain Seligo" /LENGTH=88 /DNA_ID=CAMNT_0053983711 /DNA_START=140 /DNA_END=403 /DNA_ORIENTATION=+